MFFNELNTLSAAAGSAPFITWYGPRGERAELSRAAFLNAVIKTANFLTDELELEPEDTVGLRLPLHWQVPVWLAATEAAGLSVRVLSADVRDTATTVSVDDDPARAEAGLNPVRVLVSTHPMGLPQTPAPDGVIDHAGSVPGQPDVPMFDVSAARWPGVSLAESSGETDLDTATVRAEAVARSQCWGLRPGGRLLSRLPPWTRPGLLACWAAPLLLRGSVVLTRTDDPGLAAVERITSVARS